MVEDHVYDVWSMTYVATPIAVAVREAVSLHPDLVHLPCNLDDGVLYCRLCVQD